MSLTPLHSLLSLSLPVCPPFPLLKLTALSETVIEALLNLNSWHFNVFDIGKVSDAPLVLVSYATLAR